MVKESTGYLVCRACNDGAYDSKRHPQLRSAPPRREPKVVPDARSPIDLTQVLASETLEVILTENESEVEVEPVQWTPRMSTWYAT
jgi:hypothetical protein